MKLDGPRLDMHSVCDDETGTTLVGWRRRIEVREDAVYVSVLASPESAGIDIGEPGPEVMIRCEPRGMSVNPISRAGFLALDFLEPSHVYWLELRPFGGIQIEREDGSQDHRWYWPLPVDLWRKIRCG